MSHPSVQKALKGKGWIGVLTCHKPPAASGHVDVGVLQPMFQGRIDETTEGKMLVKIQ